MKTMIDLFPVLRFSDGDDGSGQWIQIMKVGKFVYQGKPIEITQADLNQFAENYRNKVRGVDLAVDVSHRPEDGSVGWFEDVKVEAGRLMARVRWTDEGKELIESGKFRYFSPEWSRQWTDNESGKSFRNVLFGGALTNRPFLKNMDPIGIAMSEDGLTSITFWSDGSDDDEDQNDDDQNDDNDDDDDSNSMSEAYDPDNDGDDDSTSDPDKNPDWIDDVRIGALPFDKCTGRQQQQLKARGITKAKADGARAQFIKDHPEHKDQQFEDRSTKASQKPNETRVTMTEKKFDKFVVALFAEDDVTNAHKSPPAGKPKDPSQYADPKNFKYPIDKDHIQAAISYYNQSGMMSKGGYNADQWSSIGSRIVTAANKLIGEGYSLKDGKIQTPTKMDDGSGTDDGTKQLNPDDGSSDPKPIDDDEAGKFSEPNHKKTSGGGIMSMVPEEQYNALLERVNKLESENKRHKMSEKVDGFIKAGKMAPAARESSIEMMIGMNEEQANKFSEMMEKTPQVFSFSEEGFSGDTGSQNVDADALMSELQVKYMSEGKTARESTMMAFDEVSKRGLK